MECSHLPCAYPVRILSRQEKDKSKKDVKTDPMDAQKSK